MKAVPVHGRALHAGRDHQEHRADAVIRMGAILEDVAGDGSESEDLGVVLAEELHGRRAAVGGHPGMGSAKTACSKQGGL